MKQTCDGYGDARQEIVKLRLKCYWYDTKYDDTKGIDIV